MEEQEAPITTRELEWYDLETRMRNLLHEHLAPVLARNVADREAHADLRAAHEDLVAKVTRLDTLVCGDSGGGTALSQVYAKFAELESSRKAEQVSVQQTFALMSEKLSSFQFQINSGRDSSVKVERMNELLSKDMVALKALIQSHQDIVVEEMQKLNAAFSQMNTTYTEFAVRTEETAQRALVNSGANETGLGHFKQDIEHFTATIEGFRSSLRQLHSDKLNIADFRSAEDALQLRIEALQKEDARLQQEIIERDSFLDKYFPLRVATMVSNALHASLDPMGCRRAAEYEHAALTLLNERTLEQAIDDRPTAVTRIVMAMKDVEQRKVQLLSEEIPEEKAPEPEIAPPEPLDSPVKEPPSATVKVDISAELASFAESKVYPELAAMRASVNKELTSQAAKAKQLYEENQLYAQEVLATVEEYQRKQTKERADSLLLVAENKHKLEENANQVAGINDCLTHMALIIVCLVENAQVQHALNIHEEKERPEATPHPPQANTPANALHSPNVSFHQSFVAQSTTSRLRSLHPVAPMYYRNQRFTRRELLNLMSKVLETSWTKASKHFPWNKQDFEHILLDAATGVKSEEDEALPVLASRRRRSSVGARRHRISKLS